MYLIQHTAPTVALRAFLEEISISRDTSHVSFPFRHTEYWKVIYPSVRFDMMLIIMLGACPASSNMSLSEIAFFFFFFLLCLELRKRFGGTPLIHASSGIFTHRHLCAISAHASTVTKGNDVSVLR